jgi:phosphonate transport system ATP-binding protein
MDSVQHTNPRQTGSLVRFDEVGVTYGNGTVGLHPTSLAIARDQLTVLLGRSGAGKSSLLRLTNDLVQPTSGTVRVDGLGDLSDPKTLRAHRRQTAMIFQQHQLIGRSTALQNVLTGRLGHHTAWRTLWPMPVEDRRLALACLERVGLMEQALQRTDTLSGGQQQRVGIARALAQAPKLILADEPVASLDPATSRHVLDLLRTVCRQDGIPAIISLHQLDLAERFADRIIGLADGRVVFDGAPAALGETDLIEIYGEIPDAESKAAPVTNDIVQPMEAL